MTTTPASHSGISAACIITLQKGETGTGRGRILSLLLLVGACFFFVSLGFAQNAPKVTGVEPATGKVNESVTVSGANLAKDSVVAVFLSDEKLDYKATILNQATDKIVMKVPQVKPGGYNVSIQVGNGILIEPVRFTVEQ
jgi:hypothetical protein